MVISENGRVMANPETGFIGYWTAERYIALAGVFVLLAQPGKAAQSRGF